VERDYIGLNTAGHFPVGSNNNFANTRQLFAGWPISTGTIGRRSVQVNRAHLLPSNERLGRLLRSALFDTGGDGTAYVLIEIAQGCTHEIEHCHQHCKQNTGGGDCAY